MFFLQRISEIEPKYYADGEDAYAMKRDLVSFSQQHDTLPADPSTFYETKTPEERKRLAAIAQENRNMEEWFARWRKILKIQLTVELLRKHKNGAWIQITQHPLQK